MDIKGRQKLAINNEGLAARDKKISKGIFFAFLAAVWLINLLLLNLYADYNWGNTFQMDGIVGHHASLGISDPNDQVSIKFTAQYDGFIDQVWFPYQTEDAPQTRGKQVRINIQTNSAGYPTGIALSTVVFTQPSVAPFTSWRTVTFSTGASCSQNNTYHIVFTAIDDQSPKETSRLICGSPVEDTIPRTQVTDGQMNVCWKDAAGAWETRNLNPIFIVRYNDDGTYYYQGVPYATGQNDSINLVTIIKGFGQGTDDSISKYCTRIGGTSWRSMVFNVTGGDKGVVSVNLLLQKTVASPADSLYLCIWDLTSDPDDLVVSTQTILSGDVPQGSWGWVTKSFVGSQLANNRQYRLQLWSPSSSAGDYLWMTYRTVLTDPGNKNESGAVDVPYRQETWDGQTNAFFSYSENSGVGWTNYSDADAGYEFTIDNTPPDFARNIPQNNAFLSSLPAITGTANDGASRYMDPRGLEICIKNVSAVKYWVWTGSAWEWIDDPNPSSAEGQWISSGCPVGPGLVTWQYYTRTTNPPPNTDSRVYIEHNRKYKIIVKIKDSAGNYSTSYSTAVFTYDVYTAGPPEQPDSITQWPPPNSQFCGVLTPVYGTARDNTNSGINYVKWYLMAGPGNGANIGKYWDELGNAWVVSAPDQNVDSISPAGGWNVDWQGSLVSGETQMVNGATYYFWTMARDRVLPVPNEEQIFTTNTFRWDGGMPISTITYPTNNSLIKATPPEFTGRAEDTLSGIEKVEILFMNKDSGEYWTGGAWSGAEPSDWPDVNYDVAMGTWSWLYTGPALVTADYLVVSRAKDIAGNYQKTFNVPGSSHTATVDATPPTSGLTKPSTDDVYYKNLAAISGTASDNMLSDKVYVQLSSAPGYSTYWSGYLNQWVNSSTWTVATSWSPWYLPISGAFVSGVRYKVKCYAVDSAANAESIPGDSPGARTKYFYYDNTVPISTVTVPVNGSFLSSLVAISGTSNNDQNPNTEYDAGMYKCYIQITKSNDQYSWNNVSPSTGWVAGLSTWNEATPILGDWANFYLNVQDNPFEPGFSYRIRSRGIDNAIDAQTEAVGSGNKEFDPNPSVGQAPYTEFTYDPVAPTSLIQYPGVADTRLQIISQFLTISGTANDGVRVRETGGLELNIWRVGSNYYYNGTGWADAGSQDAAKLQWILIENFTGNYNYTYYTSSATWLVRISSTEFSDPNQYQVRCKSKDKAGNYDTVLSTRTYFCDRTPPASSVVLPPNNSYRNDSSLTMISGTCSGPVNEDVPASVDYMRYKIYYTTGGAGSTYRWQQTAPDAGNWVKSDPGWQNVTYMGGETPNQEWRYSNLVLSWNTDQRYEIELQVTDKASNQAQSSSGFWYDITKPTTTITMPDQPVVNSLPTISGYAGDKTAGFSGVNDDDSVQIRIASSPATGFDRFWSGSLWVSAPDTWQNADEYSGDQGTKLWKLYNDGDTSIPAWDSDINYQISVRAKDLAGNWSNIYSTAIFKVDTGAPDTVIVRPSVSSLKVNFKGQALATISGTAKDLSSELLNVEIRVSTDVTYTYCWFGQPGQTGYWLAGSSWNVCSGGSGGPVGSNIPWYYTMPISSFTSGTRYYFEARATDLPKNTDSTPDEKTNILIDYTVPNSVVNLPQENQIVGPGFVQITGTANDPAGPGGESAGINFTEIRLRQVFPEKFWDGSLWQDPPEPGDYPNVSPGNYEDLGGGVYRWYYNFSSSWTNNAKYELTSRVVDASKRLDTEGVDSGNEQWPVGSPPWVRTFYYDETSPRSIITNVIDGDYKNSLATISGTADDNVNTYPTRAIDSVKAHIYDTINNKTYNGNNDPNLWATGDLPGDTYWYNASYVGVSSGTWTFNSPNWQHTIKYRIVSKSLDKAGNYEINVSTVYFTYDIYESEPEKPNSWITEPIDDQHFNVKFSSIVGSSEDNVRGEITEVRLKIRLLTPHADPSLNDSTTYYWDNVSQDWASAEPIITNWPSASATDGSFNSNLENWYWATPQSGLAAEKFWKPGDKYDVISKTKDKTGNWELKYSTITFVYELDKPSSTIVYPSGGGYVSQTGTVYGVSVDSYPGVIVTDVGNDRGVKVRVQDLRYSTTYYTISSGWIDTTPEQAWNFASLSGNATFWWLSPKPTWASGAQFESNVYCRDKAGNTQTVYSTSTFTADFEFPQSTVTYPVHGSIIQTELPTISGSCSDNIVLTSVKVSYKKLAGTTTGYWDVSIPGSLDSKWSNPVEVFYDANIIGTRWEATGVSTPVWISTLLGIDYEIYAKGIDGANNETPKPPVPNGYQLIKFTCKTPAPVSKVTVPASDNLHYKISEADTVIIKGESQYSTTVQVKIIDFGADLTENSGGDDLCWNGTQWVSTNTFNDNVGVTSFNSGDGSWTMTIYESTWTGNRKYRVKCHAKHIPNAVDQSADWVPDTSWTLGRIFIVDSSAPVTTVTMPPAGQPYRNTLPTLSASAVDVQPGEISNVYFRVMRTKDSKYFNQVQSTFTDLSGSDTDLTATFVSGNLWNYTTTFMQTGGAWENDEGYQVQVYAKDKAYPGGYSSDAGLRSFTYDIIKPTATLVVPSAVSASDNIKSLATISGSAVDNFSDSNKNVQISIKRNREPLRWWGGSSFNQGSEYWVSSPTYLSPSATFWTYTPSGLDDQLALYATYYTITVRAIDIAGSTQTYFVTGVSSRTFLYDRWSPDTTITFPSDNQAYKPTAVGGGGAPLTGSANDNQTFPIQSGLDTEEIRLSRIIDGNTYYWQGAVIKFTSWNYTNNGWIDAPWVGMPNWEYSDSIDWGSIDREYVLEGRAEDNSGSADGDGIGNIKIPGDAYDTVRFIVDDTPPSVKITTPTSTAINSLSTISGTANCSLSGTNIVDVQFSTGTSPVYY